MLQNKISIAREVEVDRRLDQIAKINEALTMTQSLGIKKSILNGPTLNVVDGNLPLYMLGSDLLLAEKKVLEMRKKDDPFIPGLRGWQEELSLLSSITIESDKFAAVRVDSVTDYAEKVKPKKALIFAVAGVLGLMLGIFAALIRSAVKRRKDKLAAV